MGAVALDNGSSSSGPRNRSPESTDTAIDAVENTVATGKLSEATDADGDELTYALAKQPANGRVTVDADGSYTYTPNKDFFGSDSFTYTIDDGQGGVITKKANITVEGVNDAPVSTDSSIDMVEVASSNLVTPTKFESPNHKDWGFFCACNIRADTYFTSRRSTLI